MTTKSLLLTDRAIAGLPFASSGQYFARDTDLPGFMVLIGKRKKTFVVQGERRIADRRLSVRMKVGDVGSMPARSARASARDVLGKIAAGIDPRTRRRNNPSSSENAASIVNPTLRSAWVRYRDGHMKKKGRSAGTIISYRDHIERLLVDWLDKPLSELGADPSMATVRHEKLTRENGSYIANGCMRTLRAVYNHARKGARSLPADGPVSAIDWNAEHRRNTALGLSELGDWFGQLAALGKNPIRREFHLFMLLSGHRPDALRKARVEHVDFRARVLHIPKPKGGEIKAFDIPLSRAMICCLVRVMRLGRVLYAEQADTWLFPADSKSGHIIEYKEKRADLAKWGNDLRQTFRTIAQASGVAELDVHLLMNHSIPGVNAGYITRNKLLSDHLREQQETISRRMMECDRARQKQSDQKTWPMLTSRHLLSDMLGAEAKAS